MYILLFRGNSVSVSQLIHLEMFRNVGKLSLGILLSVQEVLTYFIYSKSIYKLGQDFLDIQYVVRI